MLQKIFTTLSKTSIPEPPSGRATSPRSSAAAGPVSRHAGGWSRLKQWSNRSLSAEWSGCYIYDSIPSFIHLPPSCRSFKDFLSCTVCRKKKEVSYWQVRHLTEPGLTVWGFAGLSVSQVSVESAWSAWSKGLTKQIWFMSGTTESSRNTCLFCHKPTNCKVGFQMDTPAIA